MNTIYNYFKPLGKTPLQLIDTIRQADTSLSDKKITYVGRLDPLAQGVQILVVDPTAASIDGIKGLPKEYTCDLVLGAETDSYDTLGVVVSTNNQVHQLSERLIKQTIDSYVGKQNQPYPPFSGVKVQGQPLHYWASQGKIDQVTIPTHNVEIYKIKVHHITCVPITDFLLKVQNQNKLVTGNFRQSLIAKSWDRITSETIPGLVVVALTIHCSSGTYIRQLCHEIGQKLKVGGLADNIIRTKVGTYTIDESLRV